MAGSELFPERRKDQRTSWNQGQRVPLGGIVGEFHLRGGIQPLWPWLWTGQWTHIGKAGASGSGAIPYGFSIFDIVDRSSGE